eukprot:TRINITY_DN6183_c0_g1_i2.p1 TRINITY_DN6183_c0_g1~~TRINITY_DN6183_c0_g1_i2.p1  ORF type:complete len:615 (-),score=108.12 TRINITY_DN6183_c0_g1_i2:994-2838(-)
MLEHAKFEESKKWFSKVDTVTVDLLLTYLMQIHVVLADYNIAKRRVEISEIRLLLRKLLSLLSELEQLPLDNNLMNVQNYLLHIYNTISLELRKHLETYDDDILMLSVKKALLWNRIRNKAPNRKRKSVSNVINTGVWKEELYSIFTSITDNESNHLCENMVLELESCTDPFLSKSIVNIIWIYISNMIVDYNYDAAEQIINLVQNVLTNYNHKYISYYKAFIHYRKQRFADALHELESLEDKYNFPLLEGLILYAIGSYEESIPLFQKCSNFGASKSAMGHHMLGCVFAMQEKPLRSVQKFTQALQECFDERLDSLYNIALQKSKLKQYDAVHDSTKLLIQGYNNFGTQNCVCGVSDFYYVMAHNYIKQGKFANALEIFQDIIENIYNNIWKNCKDVSPYLIKRDIIFCFLNQGMYDNAIELCTELLGVYKHDVACLIHLSDAYYSKLQIPHALNTITHAYDIVKAASLAYEVCIEKQSEFTTFNYKGDIIKRNGVSEEVFNEEKRKIFKVDIYNNMGIIYQSVQRYEGALQLFNRAISIDPQNEISVYNVCLLLKKIGHDAGARAQWANLDREKEYGNDDETNSSQILLARGSLSKSQMLNMDVIVTSKEHC